MILESLQQERQRILDIAQRYHAHNLRLFGSVVRGEERENSDIDLLVDFAGSGGAYGGAFESAWPKSGRG